MKKPDRPNQCNVLVSGPLSDRIWQFSQDGTRPKLEANLTVPSDKPAPANIVRKTWRNFVNPRLNIAWLPAEQVFLRVVQLPQADFSEIGSMLEFQLEKLSPLPVAQIVWSFEIVPSREINNITAIVIIVARDLVEERLGALEARGYQPDRLELPHVYQLVAQVPDADGVWIYPWSENGKEYCLAAWWFTGTMRNLQLIHLPTAGDRGGVLKEQLLKTAWAGEMEGWLNFPIRWRIVATPETGAEWQKLFQDWVEGSVDVSEQMPIDQLSEFAASRTLKGTPAANLLPPGFAERYRQEFVDRLWMRGLAALLAVYVVATLSYFAAVQVVRLQMGGVQRQITSISQSYTNTLRLREQVQVLQDQLNLKYAALDSWKAASDLLPAEVTLASLVFGKGQSLELRGTADNARALADYNDAMRNYTVGGQPFFKAVSPPTSTVRPGSTSLSWAFTCDVSRQEIQ